MEKKRHLLRRFFVYNLGVFHSFFSAARNETLHCAVCALPWGRLSPRACPAGAAWFFPRRLGCFHTPCSGRGGRKAACAAHRANIPGRIRGISTAVMINPGVQKPHCTAASSINACWMSESSPFGAEQALQRADLLAVRPDGKVNAGVETLPVDEHVACAALAYLAALLDRMQIEIVAQKVGQRCAHIHHFLHGLSIDRALNPFILHFLHQSSPPLRLIASVSARRASSSARCRRNSRVARQLVRGFTSSSAAFANASTVSLQTGLPRAAASAEGARWAPAPATP